MYGSQQPSMPFNMAAPAPFNLGRPNVAQNTLQHPSRPKEPKKKSPSKMAVLAARFKDALGPIDFKLGAPDWHAPTSDLVEARAMARRLDGEQAQNYMKLDALKKQHERISQRADGGQELTDEDIEFAEHEREQYDQLMHQISEIEEKRAHLREREQIINEMRNNEVERSRVEKAKREAQHKQEQLEALRAAQINSPLHSDYDYHSPPHKDDDIFSGITSFELERMLADTERRRRAEARARSQQQSSRSRYDQHPFPHQSQYGRDPFSSQRTSATSYLTGSSERSRLASMERMHNSYRPQQNYHREPEIRRSASTSGLRGRRHDPDPFGVAQDPYLGNPGYVAPAHNRTRSRTFSGSSVPFGGVDRPEQRYKPDSMRRNNRDQRQPYVGPSRMTEPMFNDDFAQNSRQNSENHRPLSDQQDPRIQEELRRAQYEQQTRHGPENNQHSDHFAPHSDIQRSPRQAPRSPQNAPQPISGLSDADLMLLVDNAELRDMLLAKLSRPEQEELIRRLKQLRAHPTPAYSNAPQSENGNHVKFAEHLSPHLPNHNTIQRNQSSAQHPGQPPLFRTPVTEHEQHLPGGLPSPMFNSEGSPSFADDFEVLRKGQQINRRFQILRHLSQGPLSENSGQEPIQQVAAQIIALNKAAHALKATGIINLETNQKDDGSFSVSGDAVVWM